MEDPFTTSDVLIVGLGNPGSEYERTRHNAGFLVLDRLFEELSRSGESSIVHALQWKSKFQGNYLTLSRSPYGEPARKLFLLKPQTFMNLSGESVQALAKYFQIPREQICVIHDDLDFPLGTCRIRKGGGDGGHNGLKSITKLLGGASYVRVRFGIGRPNIGQKADIKGDLVHSWVLGAFGKGEQDTLSGALDTAVDAVCSLLENGFEQTQMTVNRRSEAQRR
ncbi:aminoacyl-tRNA hydrolase [bacterium]|jgi:PTH1 family peptidyl-tRNA hydrolase|nr:aminoacyl-tRNA hydrolase [bacterium]